MPHLKAWACSAVPLPEQSEPITTVSFQGCSPGIGDLAEVSGGARLRSRGRISTAPSSLFILISGAGAAEHSREDYCSFEYSALASSGFGHRGPHLSRG